LRVFVFDVLRINPIMGSIIADSPILHYFTSSFCRD
jgi:hypothetical protein